MKISEARKGESRSRYLIGRLCIAVALSLIMILPAVAAAATRGDAVSFNRRSRPERTSSA